MRAHCRNSREQKKKIDSEELQKTPRWKEQKKGTEGNGFNAENRRTKCALEAEKKFPPGKFTQTTTKKNPAG